MPLGPDDRLFARFRRTGDPRALGKLFDRTAPELLRVALHLTGDRHRAEDLVQSTFLTALEQASRYDTARRVLPWLLAILANTARRWRRHERRQIPHAELPAGATPGDVADAAAGRELVQRCEQTVAALPEPYRLVLLLHLRHGLGAREIATAVERPASTVRNQIARGLALLRRALPAGAAPVVALGAGATPALAAVRARVLAHAGRTAAVSSAGVPVVLAGVVLMKKSLLVGGAAALVVLATVAGSRLATGEGEEGSEREMPIAAQSASSREENAVDEASSTAPERQAVGEPAAPPPEPSTQTVIRGRCVAAESVAPLAGCVVELDGGFRDAAAERQYASVNWKDPAKVTTSDDGAFCFAFDSHPAFRFTLWCASPERATRRISWGGLEPGRRIDLGDVALGQGAILRGRLVDERGTGVPDVRVRFRLSDAPAPDDSGWLQVSQVGAVSTHDGTFRTDHGLPPGIYVIQALSGAELVGPSFAAVPDGQRAIDLEIVVRRPEDRPSLCGLAVDEDGAPARGIFLEAQRPGTFSTRGHASTLLDGKFTIYRSEDGDDPVQLVLSVGNRDEYKMLSPTAGQTFAWGTRDIRVVMRRHRSSLRLTVVEAGTRQPVESYFVRCSPTDRDYWSSGWAKARADGHHEDGIAVLTGIMRGVHELHVYPRDAELVPTAPQVIEVGDGETPLTVEVQRRIALTVRVERNGGRPVEGTRVEIVRKQGPGELSLDTIRATPFEAYERFKTTGPMAIVLDSGETDARGELVLRGPPSAGELALAVRGPGHVPTLQHSVVIARDRSEPVVIRVHTGATVTGRVTPASVIESLSTPHQRPTVVFFRPGMPEHRYPAGRDRGFALADDGSIDADGLPAGTLEAHLYFVEPNGSHIYEQIGIVAGLRDGEVREADFDLAALAPARITGRITLDGAPFAHGLFLLQARELEDGRLVTAHGRRELYTDADGGFDVQIRADAIRLAAYTERGSRPQDLIADPAWIPLAPGQTLTHDFHLVRRVLRLRVLEHDGTPARARSFSWDWLDEDLRTDEDGWLVFDPAPVDPVVLRTWPRGIDMATAHARERADPGWGARHRVELEPVALPAGETSAEVELRLPSAQ